MTIKTYSALITGSPNWELTVASLNIDLTRTLATVELKSYLEQDHIEALTRLAGKMEVYEIEDGGVPQQIVSVDMEDVSQQGLVKESDSRGRPKVVVTLRAKGAVAPWTTVTDEDVSSTISFSSDRGSSMTWRIQPYQRQITPGSTVLRGPNSRMTVDRSAINILQTARSMQSITQDGSP